MTRPGFTRVFIPARNKTTRIRTALANNPNYMNDHGMVKMPDPVAPLPIPIPTELVEPKPTITKAKPIKTT